MAQASILNSLQQINRVGIGIPILVLLMLGMMVLPLPPFLLDVLFTFNIALSLIVLLAGVYSLRPLDFAVFPTVLLVATLLRLALNVASTRVILLNGHTGTDAVGKVIQAFGEVVIGGNFAVGIIVFIIVVIINFVVVTKGAGRISEVSARFILDAMPGKQMAIDADLNAGLIDQKEAKARRQEITLEADFYGAMDGASKFVRGDAIAGILILFINIVGGLAIGMTQHDLTFSGALDNYALLTIGDGLVAQVPALLLSVAAAIMVTRVSSSEEFSSQVMKQLLGQPKALSIASAILGLLGLIPGMPHLAFWLLAAILGGGAYFLIKQQKKPLTTLGSNEEDKSERETTRELGWQDIDFVDHIGLEVGYRLIPMVDANQHGMLLGRIRGVRKKLTQSLGFLIPPVHIRDNLDIEPNQYRLLLKGVVAGTAEIYLDREFAINPGQVFGKLEGIPGKDPAFGLDAVWIIPSQRAYAQNLGFTVVDPSTVIATHLSQLIQTHAHELLGFEEVQKLLDRLSETAPKLVEALVPQALPLAAFTKLLRQLLLERVPIRDIRTIAEAILENSQKGVEGEALCAAVRIALGPMIIQEVSGDRDELPVMVLYPELEQILLKTMQAAPDQGIILEPSLADRLHDSLMLSIQKQEAQGEPAVLLVNPQLRWAMAKLCRSISQHFAVMAFSELPEVKKIRVVATIGAPA